MQASASTAEMNRFAALLLLSLLPTAALASPADELVSDGQKSLAARDIVAAMAAFTKALEAEPAHAQAAYERGRLLLVIGEPENAIADFTTAVITDPAFGRAYVGRAQAKLALKDAKGAVEDFNQAIAAAPKDFEVHVSRAAFRLKIGNIPGARADLETAKAVADEATAKKIGEMLERLGGS